MFEVTTKSTGESTVLSVRGEVDLETSPQLWNEMESALERSRSLKVELKDVSYIDSSGIATLIKGLKHANQSEVSFVILDPSPRVVAVMELAQLHTLFSIERSG